MKEDDGDMALEELPELVISEHPNFVTARGLWLIEDQIQQLEQARDAARLSDDTQTLAHKSRDLRYWQQRLASAQLVQPESPPAKARFGVTVALEFADGSKREYTLVGEDEADPGEGLLSWVAPVAQALFGHQVGDVVQLPDGQARVVALSVRS